MMVTIKDKQLALEDNKTSSVEIDDEGALVQELAEGNLTGLDQWDLDPEVQLQILDILGQDEELDPEEELSDDYYQSLKQKIEEGDKVKINYRMWGDLKYLRASANGGLDINNADATGTYDPRIRFQVNGANTFSMGVDNNTNDNFTIASSGNLGGTPRFAITTGGNVGIGTTAPAYKLDVSGEARIGYHGSPDTIPLVPSDFLIVFGESAMHQFGEYWGIGPIQGQGSQHFMAQIPIPVGYKARKVVIKTYRADGNYSGNPHDCYIWNM